MLHPIATNEKAKMNVQVRLSSDLLNHLDHGAASEADCGDCWAVFVLGVLGAVGGPGAPSSRPERPRLCEKCLVRTLAIQHLPRFRHRSGRSGRHVKVDSMLAGLEVAPGLEPAQAKRLRISFQSSDSSSTVPGFGSGSLISNSATFLSSSSSAAENFAAPSA